MDAVLVYIPMLTCAHELWIKRNKNENEVLDTSSGNVLPLKGGLAQPEREGEKFSHLMGFRVELLPLHIK